MKTKQQGFTLIELITVIIIIGILAATALPKFVDIKRDAQMAVLRNVAGSVSAATQLSYKQILCWKNKLPDFKDDEERTKFFASKGGNLQTEIDRKAAEEAAKNP